MIDLQPPARRDMPADRHAARRAALLNEMTARRRVPVSRLAFGGLASAALAGGVAAALIAVPDAVPEPDRPARVVPMSATQVLDRAAQTASQAAEPRPDQYVHTKTVSRADYLPGGVIRAESWYSVDGKRIGLKIEAGERFWVCEAVPKPSPSTAPADCKNQPVYRRDLPVDAKAMREWLYKNALAKALPPDVRAYSYVHEIVSLAKLTPAAQAAMFKATGTIPGVRVVQSSARHIAVGQTWRGLRSELLFEPGTYRLIGTRTVADPDRSFQPEGDTWAPDSDPRGLDEKGLPRKRYGADQKPGTVVGSWTIVDQRVVDAIPATQMKS
jgi:hypothetical protein